MGKVILGLAAPHNPNITSRPEKMSVDVQSKLDSAFSHLKGRLAEASPDCLLILTSDHVTNFFYNNAPMFCLGVSDTCTGPAPKELSELRIPRATLKVDTKMGKGLLHYGIESGIDFSYSQEMILDHAFMVPLSLLTPHMDLPIVPLHINGMLPPRPTAARCYQLGRQIGEYIRNGYEGKVAVLASGSFSGDIGGPKMGSIDTELDLEFLELVKDAKGQAMVDKPPRKLSKEREWPTRSSYGSRFRACLAISNLPSPTTSAAKTGRPPRRLQRGSRRLASVLN